MTAIATDPSGRERDAAWIVLDHALRSSGLSLCHRLGLQRADAEDVYQTVMTRLLRGRHRFDPSRGGLRSYVMTALRHEAARARRRQLATTDVPAVVIDDPRDAFVEREWQLTVLRRTLPELAAHHSTRALSVFWALVGGGSTGGVAARHRVSVHSAYKLKQRVLAHARRVVARRVAVEDRCRQ